MLLKKLLRTDLEGERNNAAILLLLSRLPKGGNLLDVGCADGGRTALYARALGVSPSAVHGIEAKSGYLEKAPPFQVSVLNLERDNFPWEAASFDLVVCNQVLEHLKNMFLPMNESVRVLREGGHFLVGVPNVAALHNRILLLFGGQPVCNNLTGPHLRCFAHKAFLRFLLSNPAVSLEACTGASLYPLPWPLDDWGADLAPSLAAGTFYLLRKTAAAPTPWAMEEGADTLL